MTPEHLANHYAKLRMSPATADYAKAEVEKFTKMIGFEELTKLYNARCKELMALEEMNLEKRNPSAQTDGPLTRH